MNAVLLGRFLDQVPACVRACCVCVDTCCLARVSEESPSIPCTGHYVLVEEVNVDGIHISRNTSSREGGNG